MRTSATTPLTSPWQPFNRQIFHPRCKPGGEGWAFTVYKKIWQHTQRKMNPLGMLLVFSGAMHPPRSAGMCPLRAYSQGGNNSAWPPSITWDGFPPSSFPLLALWTATVSPFPWGPPDNRSSRCPLPRTASRHRPNTSSPSVDVPGHPLGRRRRYSPWYCPPCHGCAPPHSPGQTPHHR